MARIAARHRSLPGCQSSQAVPPGDQGATGSLDTGRCAEPARLAHLPCAGSAADRPRQGAGYPRAFGAVHARPADLTDGVYGHHALVDQMRSNSGT